MRDDIDHNIRHAPNSAQLDDRRDLFAHERHHRCLHTLWHHVHPRCEVLTRIGVIDALFPECDVMLVEPVFRMIDRLPTLTLHAVPVEVIRLFTNEGVVG